MAQRGGLMDPYGGYSPDMPEDIRKFMHESAMQDLMHGRQLPPPSHVRTFGTIGEAQPYSSVRPMSERIGRAVMDYGPMPAKIATDIAMQPVRATKSVLNAVQDPSIPNITDAGVQAAIAAFRPLGAAKMLALGYGAAGMKDSGLLSMGATAEGGQDRIAQIRQEIQRLASEKNAVLSGKIRGRGAEAAARAQALAQTFDGQIATLQQELTGINSAAASAEAEKGKAVAEARAAKEAESLREYSRSVGTAEKARDAELARSNLFSDSEVGKVYNKLGIVTPAIAAAGAGAITRGAAALSGKLSRGMQYGLPAAVGGGTGIVASNYPVAHDAILTPAENPEKRAYGAYARELPPTHPRKAEWQSYADNLPTENPTRAAASKELYDPIKLAERSGYGLLEGAISGVTGGELAKIATNVPRVAARTGAEAVGGLLRGVGRAPGLIAEGNAVQGARVAGQMEAQSLAQARANAARASVEEQAGLLSGARRLEAGALQPAGASAARSAAPPVPQAMAPAPLRPQPQLAPVQNQTALPPPLRPQPQPAPVQNQTALPPPLRPQPQLAPVQNQTAAPPVPQAMAPAPLRSQPQPAPVQNQTALPPVPDKQPRQWANVWSDPARASVLDWVKTNPGVPIESLSAPMLRDMIIARLPPGAPHPSASLVRDRLSNLKRGTATTATGFPLFKDIAGLLNTDPGRSRFSIAGPAIGAGAMGYGLMSDQPGQ